MDIKSQEIEQQKTLKVFCCYARRDQRYLLELKTHLIPMERRGLITLRADVDIEAGAEWERAIHLHLNTAHIILLLVSSDFIASDYCYTNEMRRALERHKGGEAHVIPIILRAVDWKQTPLGKLQALPKNGQPIATWQDRDEAFNDISRHLREVVEAILAREEQQRQAEEEKVHNEQASQLAPQKPIIRPPIRKKRSFSWKATFGGIFLASLILVGSVFFIIKEDFFRPSQLPGQATTTPKNHLTPIATSPVGVNNWKEYVFNTDFIKGSCMFSNGAYHAIAPPGYKVTCPGPPTKFSNFAFQVQMTIIKGDCGGIFFRTNPKLESYYYFHVCQDGSYKLLRYDGKDPKHLLDSRSSAIKKGLNQPNLVEVRAQGSSIDLYVNNKPIHDPISDSTYSDGQIGVVAAANDTATNETEVAFSDAIVWAL